MLHIIPFIPDIVLISQISKSVLNSQKSDSLLLIQDGVYAIISNFVFKDALQKLAENYLLYALKEDIQARGLTEKVFLDIYLIDYLEFVDLVVKHKHNITW